MILLVLLATAACVALGSAFRPGPWYAALEKPAATPPDAVFAPVWIALYVMIAIAGCLLVRAPRSDRRRAALALFWIQLVLNGAWSWLAFGRQSLGLAFVDIATLLVILVALIATSFRVRTAAAWLLVPYALWVAFAAWLNLRLWQLNA